MSKINDGGAAFPNSVQPDFQYAEAGMTLRDWFAGQALAAHIRNAGEHGHSRPDEYDQCRADTARRSYAIADAMIAARGQP